MKRAEIRLVDFEPVRGSEANKIRPAVIVSNDPLNRATTRRRQGVVTVVPLTSNVTHVYNFQVLLPAAECGLPRDSKAQVEQVRAVDYVRVGPQMGFVPSVLMARIERAIRLHFALEP